jgi:hypothetical protein
MNTKTKKTDKQIVKESTVTEKKKVSKTWLALMKGKQYGEIVDLKAVLK